MTPLNLILLTLAALAVAYYLTAEAYTGPFHLLAKLRARFPLGGLTTCIVCALPWVATLVVLLLVGWQGARTVVWIAAVVGGALALRSYTGMGLHDN